MKLTTPLLIVALAVGPAWAAKKQITGGPRVAKSKAREIMKRISDENVVAGHNVALVGTIDPSGPLKIGDSDEPLNDQIERVNATVYNVQIGPGNSFENHSSVTVMPFRGERVVLLSVSVRDDWAGAGFYIFEIILSGLGGSSEAWTFQSEDEVVLGEVNLDSGNESSLISDLVTIQRDPGDEQLTRNYYIYSPPGTSKARILQVNLYQIVN